VNRFTDGFNIPAGWALHGAVNRLEPL